ncbi:MAG: hypothetical protein BroJett040_15070 [Oligoflexia bacterium]|nr:MAG: hypothetical protein BroJett040_15070 [Oligoflexia bacterium]
MKQEALTQFQDTHLTIIALMIFAIMFVGTIFFTYHKSRKSFFEKMQNLPLDEGGLQ